MKQIILNKKKIQEIDDLTKVKFQDLSPNLTQELSPILIRIHDSSSSEDQKIFLDYFIIRLVTIIEVYFRDWVIKLIDDYKLESESLGEISPKVLKSIKKYKEYEITIGKIISTSYNLQNLQEINDVFSTLLHVDFFESIRKFEFRNFKPNRFRNWDQFFEIFQERHKIVHNLTHHTNYSKNDISNIGEALQMYLIAIDSIIARRLFFIKPEILKKQNSFLYHWALRRNKGESRITRGPTQSTPLKKAEQIDPNSEIGKQLKKLFKSR